MIKTVLCTAAIGLAALLGFAGTAQAESSSQLSPQDLAAARAATATQSVHDELARFTYPGAAKVAMTAAAANVSTQTIPVYELARDFVAGAPGAKAGRLAYVAVPATDGAGRAATVWSANDGTGWQAVNVASGDREQRLAAALPQGAYLLHEPQIDAWYAVTGDTLRSLDGATAGQVTSMADYRRAVTARYGDKLPGSSYQREGMAGGFTALSNRNEDGPQAPAGVLTPGVLALVIGFALVGAGALLSTTRLLRRR